MTRGAEIGAVVEITAVDPQGHPVAGVEITVYNAANGHITSRYSDGSGYTNNGLLGAPGDLCTLLSNGYRFTGSTADPHIGNVPSPQYYTFTAEPDQKIVVTVEPFRRPSREFPRFWKGQMCGLRLPYLPNVGTGAKEDSLFLSWLYHLYSRPTRDRIRRDYLRRYSHWLMSWPDAQDAGLTPNQFIAVCREIEDEGGHVCVMLSAKPTNSGNVRDLNGTLANIALVLIPLLNAGIRGFCVGWELSLWLSPLDVQFLIDIISPIVMAVVGRLYVHFQQGYGSFQQDGKFFADFWNANVGKLTGILRQEIITQTPQQRRYDSGGVVDVLIRFSGYYGVAPGFDDVELEISAQLQFDGQMTEDQGDALGQWAIDAPPQTGPGGAIARVNGSGNGSLQTALL